MRHAPILAPLAAALMLAPPAAAQSGGVPAGSLGGIAGPSIGSQLADIERRAERAREKGDLSRRDRRRIEREADRIAHLDRLYAHGGLSASERKELEARTNYLRDAVTARSTAKAGPPDTRGR